MLEEHDPACRPLDDDGVLRRDPGAAGRALGAFSPLAFVVPPDLGSFASISSSPDVVYSFPMSLRNALDTVLPCFHGELASPEEAVARPTQAVRTRAAAESAARPAAPAEPSPTQGTEPRTSATTRDSDDAVLERSEK
jgi:hypothetical protein